MSTAARPRVDEVIAKSQMVRSNSSDVGVTDNGVLTQVFVDNDANDGDGEITIASINTISPRPPLTTASVRSV